MSEATVPERVLGFYDREMWEHFERGEFRLQTCDDCGYVRYPPGPVCPQCLAAESQWKRMSGEGHILSHATFHRGYLPGYPTPYTVVAVRLDEGPIVISNIEGATHAEEDWIDSRVRVTITRLHDVYALPRFELLR